MKTLSAVNKDLTKVDNDNESVDETLEANEASVTTKSGGTSTGGTTPPAPGTK